MSYKDMLTNKYLRALAIIINLGYLGVVLSLAVQYCEKDILVSVVCFAAIIDDVIAWQKYYGDFNEIATWIRKQL